MFHIFNLLYPLILISYLSRAVGFENYAYILLAQAFAFYAFVFCELGVEYSGIRILANTPKEKYSKVVSSIITLKIALFFTVVITCLAGNMFSLRTIDLIIFSRGDNWHRTI